MPPAPGLPPIRDIGTLAVIVPARDEVDRVGACIDAIGVALSQADVSRRLLVVVDDGSGDGTATVAAAALTRSTRSHGIRGVLHRVDVGSAGRARRIGVEVLRAHLTEATERCWVLSTDADSLVPPTWASGHLAHARAGAPAVAGVVSLTSDADGVALSHRWTADYLPTIAADGSHPYVHATNLGIRLDVLDAVGGMPAVAHEEDAALWQRLRAAGVAPVADASLTVATSARRDGRVPHGFAHALTTLYGATGV